MLRIAAAIGIFLYCLLAVASSGAWGVVMGAVTGPIAVELIIGRDRPREWQVAAVRRWLLILAIAWLLSPLQVLRMGSWTVTLLLLPIAAGVIALTGWWWLQVLNRPGALEIRPGYIIGGLAAIVATVFAIFGVLLLSGDPRSLEMLQNRSLVPLARMHTQLLPILTAINFRILYAGLPPVRGGSSFSPRHRVTLIAWVCAATAWLVVALWLLTLRPLSGFGWASAPAVILLWALACLWAWNLWKAGARPATS